MAITSPTQSATPDSSPSRMQLDSPSQQLTPRSKIKAMLAAVDAESGSDTKPHSPKEHYHTNPEDPAPVVAFCDDGDDEDGNRTPMVPQGKLAARLLAQNDRQHIQASPTAVADQQSAGSAYERVKKQLLSQKYDAPPPATSSRFPKEDEDEGPILASKRQKLQSKRQNPTTPPGATPMRSPQSEPGLFLTPRSGSLPVSPRTPARDGESDSDLPANPQRNERFLALVAREKAKREAKQKAENAKKAAREAHLQDELRNRPRVVEPPLGDSEDASDDDDAGARKLTQQARPTRKASKKAMEEMNRETQRMNRNMQLAHQAKTKKRITKESLFARFNFRTTTCAAVDPKQPLSSSTVASSPPASDAEHGKGHETPPSSPLDSGDLLHNCPEPKTTAESMHSSDVPDQVLEKAEDELPIIQNLMSQRRPIVDKGKGKLAKPHVSAADLSAEHTERTATEHQPMQARLSKALVHSKPQHTDSDSDLEILPARRSKHSGLDAFNRLPANKASEARSLQTLRALAHLNSPPGKQLPKSKPSLTLTDLQMSLQQRARQQAAAERAEKIQQLKDRGVIIQTAEERQKDQVQIEDLVEKARQEAELIKKKEKDAAKKGREANGGGTAVDDSSDGDEDYQEDVFNDADVELSGSEKEEVASEDGESISGDGEEEEEEEEAVDADRGDGGVGLPEHNVFSEDEAAEKAEEESLNDNEDADPVTKADDAGSGRLGTYRRPRASRIIESDEEGEESPAMSEHDLPPSPDALAKPVIPGLGIAGGPALPMMGMTQAFAATMADTQTQANDRMNNDQEQDSLSFLGPVPEPDFPVFDPNDTESMIMDSQDAINPGGRDTPVETEINLQFSQSQIQPDTIRESPARLISTQDDDIPDPTQDMGFALSSPAINRFVSAPPSTVETVLLPEKGSPLKRKRGRLQRGNRAITDPSDDGARAEKLGPHTAAFEVSANAFDVLKKKRDLPEKSKSFDKRKSEAKEMVEDQALESDDEYAGLGGASDDETGGSEDEEVGKMIEYGEIDVDEGKLAALYA